MTGKTISSTTVTAGYTLSNPSYNPFGIAASGGITNTTASSAAFTATSPNYWTISNAGTVTGNYIGVTLAGSGSLVNTGHIYANQTTSIHGGFTYSSGIFTAFSGAVLMGGGGISNASSGTISGHFEGIALGGGGSVVNAGIILSTGLGVVLTAGGSISNAASGHITAVSDGIVTYGSIAATVTNNGFVSSQTQSGVAMFSGGTLDNAGTGKISGSVGVHIAGTGGSVSNATSGTITGAAFGVEIGTTSGSVGGTVLNQGSILASNSTGIAVWIHGSAQVSNAASGKITGGQIGIYSYSLSTVTNYGTISGTTFAVDNAAGFADRVIDEPSASFVGTVSGGNSIGSSMVSALELASVGSPGTFTGLGTQFIDFGQVTIDAGASWTLTGSNTVAPGVTLTELTGATVTDSGTLVNDGGILIDPSTLSVGGLTGTGSTTIAAGSTLDVSGSIATGETIRFGGGGAYLYLGTPASVAGSVTNFDVGEDILLKGIAASSVNYNSATSVLSFTGGSFALSLASGGIPHATSVTSGAEISLLCFCADTHILTPSGERRVQDLAVGDIVTTQRGEARRIEWIGTGRVLATRGRRNAATPVIVRKGALADNVPCRDLRVTKGHSLYLDDVLIPVEFLVNHRSIVWDDRAQEVALYHIELATHDVLLADGAPAESYRDDGNRWLFQNANSGWHQTPQEPCAPVLTGGPLVDAVWRRVLDRAGPRPGLPTTDQPDLHLLVDGQRVDGNARPDGVSVFRLPKPPAELRIVSRAAVPEELGTARDPRCLGVALRSVMLWNGPRVRVIEADDEQLTEGFHQFEPDNGWRWTDGDAALPDTLFEGMTGVLTVELHVACATQYIDDREVSQVA